MINYESPLVGYLCNFCNHALRLVATDKGDMCFECDNCHFNEGRIKITNDVHRQVNWTNVHLNSVPEDNDINIDCDAILSKIKQLDIEIKYLNQQYDIHRDILVYCDKTNDEWLKINKTDFDELKTHIYNYGKADSYKLAVQEALRIQKIIETCFYDSNQ